MHIFIFILFFYILHLNYNLLWADICPPFSLIVKHCCEYLHQYLCNVQYFCLVGLRKGQSLLYLKTFWGPPFSLWKGQILLYLNTFWGPPFKHWSEYLAPSQEVQLMHVQCTVSQRNSHSMRVLLKHIHTNGFLQAIRQTLRWAHSQVPCIQRKT